MALLSRLLTLITTLSTLFDIGNTNSCILHQTESECNIQSSCTWDTSLSKCVCNSIIPQDVVIIMDSSGSVQANGWIVEKQFVESLISTAIPPSSPIGIVQFATNAWIRYELFNDQNRTQILQTVSNLEYTRGWTYMLDAVTEAIWLFENQSLNPQKRLVLITDGNPMPVSQTPCDLRTQLDTLGVDVMIIGVGASWTRARIDCLVSKDTDIIEVSAFTPDAFETNRNVTDEFLCRDVTFTLTEIKPSMGIGSSNVYHYHPIPFIEFYNDVKDMDLGLYNFKIDGTFRGDISVTNIVRSIYGSNWPYGTYLVIYDNINDNINRDTAWCYDCVCELVTNNHFCNESIYISMPGSYDTINSEVNNWNVVIYDATDIIQREVMNISYGMGVATDWIVIRDGFTYELRETSCDPTNGKCWKESCTLFGTPGHLPIECQPNTCTDDNCQIGGDPNATCDLSTTLCNCNDWCYNIHNTATCNCIFPPINCSIILNTNIDNTGLPAGDASWNKPNIDWSNVYTVWYQVKWYTFQNDEHQSKIQATPVNQRGLTLFNMEFRNPNVYKQEVRAIIDFGDNPNTPNIIETETYYSDWTVCKLLTMEPTFSPTPAPTLGLPPIDQCNVTIRHGTNQLITIDVKWMTADVSETHTFNSNQFNNDYKLYFTQMDVYIPGTDNLAVRAYKISNQTFYAENLPYDYNSTQLVHNGKVQVKVSVVVHEINDSTVDLDDKYDWFDDLMYEQATICDWYTYSPTLSPTHLPSIPPSPDPTVRPSKSPTMSPTYSWWVLQGCIITVTNTNNNGNDWTITWVESDPDVDTTLPQFRRIYIYINNNEFRILNQNEFSPQTMRFSSQIPAPNITNVEIKLLARHLTKGSDSTSLEFSPNIALCEIITISPTLSPSNAPTTPIPTPSPIIHPTITPSISPTKSPTYNFPIDWCIILIKGRTVYNVTFSIPEYKNDGTTPDINDVKYMINYAQIGRNSIEANKISTNTISYNELLFTNGITINYNTEFKMTTVNNINNDITYGDWRTCIIQTMNPTINPSISPTIQPTLSPTNPDIGVFVYSNDEKNSICLGYERCACHLDQFNYNCVGLDFPQQPQIEDTYLYFLPSSGEQKSVLWIGRYPYYLHYDTVIEWEFIYLNDTNNFNSGQRVKPIRGITTINAEERLGAIVLAEFIPIPNEALDIHDPQWYMFKITNCRVNNGYNEENYRGRNNENNGINNHENNNGEFISCGIIYPSWTYIIWASPEAFSALLIDGGEPWPDWIFYLLLGASVTAVVVAYLGYIHFKNKNLKNNVDAQDQASQAMLKGIAPSAHAMNTNDTF